MSDGRDHGDFVQRLARAQAASRNAEHKQADIPAANTAYNAVNLAMRLGVELVAAMAIAVLLGWGLDRLFNTRPWLMVAMVPVGMAAGLRNLIRAVGPAK